MLRFLETELGIKQGHAFCAPMTLICLLEEYKLELFFFFLWMKYLGPETCSFALFPCLKLYFCIIDVAAVGHHGVAEFKNFHLLESESWKGCGCQILFPVPFCHP